MKVITKVPKNTGTAPKEPSAATCPSLNAIWGDQSVPKKNSSKLISLKNRNVSNIKESTMPTVVRTAIIDDINKAVKIALSTKCLAFKLGVIFL